MKKLLILAMSCNQDFFIEYEQHIKKLYAKDIIEGKYSNIEFYTYTASYDSKYHINKQLHKLYVPADDSLIGTFEKTLNTFYEIPIISEILSYLFFIGQSHFDCLLSLLYPLYSQLF